MNEIDISEINEFVEQAVQRIGRNSEAVIPLLQSLQVHYRYLPEEALGKICELTDITPADLTGVSTFYSQFRHSPMGRHTIHVCHGTACHIKGANEITNALKRNLKLSDTEDTSTDGVFTLQKVACLGCCTLAPVVLIDDVTYGHMTPEQVPKMLSEFLEFQKQRKTSSNHGKPSPSVNVLGEIRLGLGSCCIARGSGKLLEALEESMNRLQIEAHVKRVGCVGMCHQTPLLEVLPPGGESHLYARVQAADAEAILLRHFKPRGILNRIQNSLRNAVDYILIGEERTSLHQHAIHISDKPVSAFLNKQKHLATTHQGQIDPVDLDEYKQYGGFRALHCVLNNIKPEDVIQRIQSSGLRGRGGAGFPTGVKWLKVHQSKDPTHYIICNGDEGDPGAFMDRMLMESFPYRIIEGMAIAAYAIGAWQGYFYIRAEYPLAVRRIQEAIDQCKKRGLLGENILDSGFRLDLEIREGAGAFVCGEESALLASIEGKRGMPRIRPPFPSECGLWGKPTLINNVETYALVPVIFQNGPDSFANLGTKSSKGTKVFALAGKISRGGLIEVPMGISLRELIEDIGGGVRDGHRLKAVQTGGPSGGCIPADQIDIPIDYESLTSKGSIMGSGGLVVLDDEDCMVDVARYFLEFTQDQSCGKCTFCRVGTLRMLDILRKLCEGKAVEEDLDKLKYLAIMTQKGSLCGLGKTAPNPVLTTLRYFRDEYEAHLQGKCPAGVCKSLIQYSISEKCIGCTLCAQHCPTGAILMTPYQRHEISQEKCVKCGVCKNLCPIQAVIKE